MAKRKMTPERRAVLTANLARGRETAAANRAAKAAATDTSDEALLRSAPAMPAGIEEAQARRQRLLGGLDAETAALFTDEELENIEREERVRAAAEQKKQALTDIRATARQRARVEHDLIAPSVLRSEAEQRRLSEMVTFRVVLPGDGAGHRGPNGIRVDGRIFQDGQTYTEPRIVFESLLPNLYRAWFNEYQFKTLDQHKPGHTATERLGDMIPQFEVRRG